MDWLKILNESYEETKAWSNATDTRLEYLGDWIFDFTTYDGGMAELFASKALEVCDAITNKTTFDYIKDERSYEWFLLMCNIPFFSSKIEWGTSIRGCWWDSYKEGIKLDTCGIFVDGEQVTEHTFNENEWLEFLNAMELFSQQDDKETTEAGE